MSNYKIYTKANSDLRKHWLKNRADKGHTGSEVILWKVTSKQVVAFFRTKSSIPPAGPVLSQTCRRFELFPLRRNRTRRQRAAAQAALAQVASGGMGAGQGGRAGTSLDLSLIESQRLLARTMAQFCARAAGLGKGGGAGIGARQARQAAHREVAM